MQDLFTALYVKGSLRAAACIPETGLFNGPLDGVLTTIKNALGGLIWPIAGILIIGFTLLAIATVRSKSGATNMKVLLLIPVIVLGAIIVLIVFAALKGVNNSC